MIPAKVMSKEQVQRYRKTDKLLLFLRRKYPTLAERIESGPLGNYLAQTLQDRHFPKIREFVRGLYGVEDKTEPPVVYFFREVKPDKKAVKEYRLELEQKGPKHKEGDSFDYSFRCSEPITPQNFFQVFLYSMSEIIESVFALILPRFYFIARYCPELQGLQIPGFRFMTFFPNKRLEDYAHEYAHFLIHTKKDGVLAYYRMSEYSDQWKVAALCDEGLAAYAEDRYHQNDRIPTRWIEQSFVSRFILNGPEKLWDFLYNLDRVLQFGYDIRSKLFGYLKMMRLNKEQIVSAIEDGDWDIYSTIHYNLGFSFIDSLVKQGLTSQQVFALVTSQLPTIREIFYPEQYVDRMKKEGFTL